MKSLLRRVAALFCSALMLASVSFAEEPDESAPDKVLKLAWVIQTEDEKLYQLVEELKGEPRRGSPGSSGWKQWCEFVIRSPQARSYFTVRLYQSSADEDGKIARLSLTETTLS